MAKKSAKTAPPDVAQPYSEPEDGSEKDYKANRAYDNMIEAAGHRSDPHMMARVKKIAGRKHKALSGLHEELMKGDAGEDKALSPVKSIAEIRERANSKVAKNKRNMG